MVYDAAQSLSANEFFRGNGYLVLDGFLGDPLLTTVHSYMVRKASLDQLGRGDDQVPGTPCAYGDTLMETLLELSCPSIEQLTGLRLFPTYSYFRVYKRGDKLAAHVDRPSCEISVTMNIGYKGDARWPIFFGLPDGPRGIEMNPGDAVVYRGCDIAHWRETFLGEEHAQVFLHFVDQDGPNAGWKFDKRERLGLPAGRNDTRNDSG